MSAGTENRTMAALAAILGYAILIGFTDNFVRVIAADGGLWQFNFMRTAIAVVVFALAMVPFALRLRPVSLPAVVARSIVHGSALLIYFGCLAFMSVAQAAAGLFTAPIWVLLIARFVYGHALGPARIVAVAVGFLGVVLVLAPGEDAALGWASLLPVVAGMLYALGNIATREWCAQESAATLTLGFFLALGAAGLAGLLVLALVPQLPAEGADGFILRGWVVPSASFWLWTAVNAVGSMLGVGLMVRAYQMAEASRVSIFEYVILPVSALWSWVLWGEVITMVAALGIVMIVAAGATIAARAPG
ncbi:MAG: DMT family transporter [Pararhodobacter sp.]|nr:DMT family transporter [Pararhodobacter sp.]